MGWLFQKLLATPACSEQIVNGALLETCSQPGNRPLAAGLRLCHVVLPPLLLEETAAAAPRGATPASANSAAAPCGWGIGPAPLPWHAAGLGPGWILRLF